MSINTRSFRSLAALAELVPEIVYVMCGARGEVRNRLTVALPRARFLGFEPDKKEYQHLSRAIRLRDTPIINWRSEGVTKLAPCM